ncbi:MAG: GYF domain-containing protein [Bacteroidia bacterium]
MKKYFIHIDAEQKGPFDLEELKGHKITKETLVWFDGLSEWTKAEFIAELKEVLTVTPPPINKQAPPPPPIDQTKKKEEVKSESKLVSTDPKKQNSVGRTILITFFIVLAIIGCIVVFNIMTDPSNNSFVKITVNPPNPRVATSRSEEDPSSTVFAYKQGVDATIINQGGAGRILVTSTLTQNDHSYERSQEIYLPENATEDLHFTFDEAELLGGEIRYSVTAKAIE